MYLHLLSGIVRLPRPPVYLLPSPFCVGPWGAGTKIFCLVPIRPWTTAWCTSRGQASECQQLKLFLFSSLHYPLKLNNCSVWLQQVGFFFPKELNLPVFPHEGVAPAGHAPGFQLRAAESSRLRRRQRTAASRGAAVQALYLVLRFSTAMAAEKVRVKWVVNCTGEPTTFTESVLDVSSSIGDIKKQVFAQEVARGLSVRVIFLGRELADSDALGTHLRLSARAAAAGPCATASSPDTQDAPEVTLHAVLSNRPPSARPGGGAGGAHASRGDSEEGDWSVVVLGVTVLVILCVCWYHRIAYPEDFTPFSSLLLLLFSCFYAFTVRGVVLRVLKMAVGCLRRPWGPANASAQPPRPPAASRAFQEVPQRAPG